jgi:LPXTG-motif cell wall-anchored protein
LAKRLAKTGSEANMGGIAWAGLAFLLAGLGLLTASRRATWGRFVPATTATASAIVLAQAMRVGYRSRGH